MGVEVAEPGCGAGVTYGNGVAAAEETAAFGDAAKGDAAVIKIAKVHTGSIPEPSPVKRRSRRTANIS